MATVNVTPDSFSDGGVHSDINVVLSYISSSIPAGAMIIDVGGYLTCPGVAFVSVEAEIPDRTRFRATEECEQFSFSLLTFPSYFISIVVQETLMNMSLKQILNMLKYFNSLDGFTIKTAPPSRITISLFSISRSLLKLVSRFLNCPSCLN
jgi:hypothetical protein